jgi:RecA/RadA recombinase
LTKVINIFGAPGSGKSTLAFGLAYNLKLKGKEVDLAHEWIKEKLYEGSSYPFHDQLYTYAKQNKKLNQLNGKVDYIVTDSPSVQCVAYVETEPEIYPQMALDYFNRYDNLNFFIERTHPYQPSGRNQTEEQARVVGDMIRNMLNELDIAYTVLPANTALEEILKIIGEV